MTIRSLAWLLGIFLAAAPGGTILAQAAASEPRSPAGTISNKGGVFVTTDDGVRLWAVSGGQGSPAILVPNGLFLEEDFAWLTDSHRVVFYDLRNRGRSETVTDEARLSGGVWLDVADAEAVRRHFALDRVVLLGHSYLGAMVILYAREHPDHVERIIQIGPIGPAPAESFAAQATAAQQDPAAVELVQQLGAWREQAAARDQASPDLCREYWSIMGRILTGDPSHAEKIFREEICALGNEAPLHVEHHFAANILPTLLPIHLAARDLDAVQVPVLVIHGTADLAAPYEGGRAWAARLPDARLLTVAGAGHLPWLESTQRVRSAVESFLEGDWPAAASVVEEGREVP